MTIPAVRRGTDQQPNRDFLRRRRLTTVQRSDRLKNSDPLRQRRTRVQLRSVELHRGARRYEHDLRRDQRIPEQHPDER